MTDEERDARLDSVLIGGREPVTVVVQDPDPGWPVRFSAVRDLLKASLGGRALAIEHIGSTAVPGLAAKPIVDVLLTVADVEDRAPTHRPSRAGGSCCASVSRDTACSGSPRGTCTCTSTGPTTRRSPTSSTCGTDSGGRARTERCTPRRSGRWPGASGRTWTTTPTRSRQ